MLGSHVVLCMTEADCLKIMFCPPNGENRPSPGFFECIGKFRFFSQFFIFLSTWSIMKVYIMVILACFRKFLIGKFWFLRYGPKCSWPIRLQDFSINRRTLKLAVSHKEIDEINWFLMCRSNSFLRNGSLGFSAFRQNSR